MLWEVSVARGPDLEEEDEPFFRHHALRTLLQMGDLTGMLTMLRLFSLSGGLPREPDHRSRSTFFKIHFGLSGISESNKYAIISASRCHLPYRCDRTWRSLKSQGMGDPTWSILTDPKTLVRMGECSRTLSEPFCRAAYSGYVSTPSPYTASVQCLLHLPWLADRIRLRGERVLPEVRSDRAAAAPGRGARAPAARPRRQGAAGLDGRAVPPPGRKPASPDYATRARKKV